MSATNLVDLHKARLSNRHAAIFDADLDAELVGRISGSRAFTAIEIYVMARLLADLLGCDDEDGDAVHGIARAILAGSRQMAGDGVLSALDIG